MEAAVTYASGRRRTAAPCGRYGATTVVLGTALLLFGGTDGGRHRHGRTGFEMGEPLRLDHHDRI